MTFTSNIQMIGIDEATFNAASEEQRVEWGKQNTTAGFGLCGAALEWLKSKKDHIWFFSSFNTFGQMHSDLHVLKDRFIYRLAPDYQPPVEDQARASLKEGWTFVGNGRKENRKSSDFISNYESDGWCYDGYIGNLPNKLYAVRNDAPDDIWQRFGIERNPHKPEKKWYLHVNKNDGSVSVFDSAIYGNCTNEEVTAEYADYLRNKPEGEWELRKVKKGDVFGMVGFRGMDTVAHRDFTTSESNIENRGYRWCKPRNVEGWVEYPIEAVGGIYCVIGLNGGKYRLDKAANRVGFGGVQFDGQEDKAQWFTGTNAGIYPDGQIAKYSFNDCDDDAAPAVPVRARFWEVPK